MTQLLQDSNVPSIVQLTRALQSLLIRNYYPKLHQNLVKTFYNVYKQVLTDASTQTNSLLFLLAYFITKKNNYRILFQVLNNYLGSHSADKRVTIED